MKETASIKEAVFLYIGKELGELIETPYPSPPHVHNPDMGRCLQRRRFGVQSDKGKFVLLQV
jgi:hypothetical protein